jgi:hypothetical protein
MFVGNPKGAHLMPDQKREAVARMERALEERS